MIKLGVFIKKMLLCHVYQFIISGIKLHKSDRTLKL